MKDPEVQEETKPEEKEKKTEKLKLLPPVSFYGKNHVEPQGLKQTPEDPENKQKSEVSYLL
jgi:hypothetical protein